MLYLQDIMSNFHNVEISIIFQEWRENLDDDFQGQVLRGARDTIIRNTNLHADSEYVQRWKIYKMIKVG